MNPLLPFPRSHAALTLLLATTAAHAQNPPADEPPALSTVRVRAAPSSRVATEAASTTTKLGAPLYETPQSVSVITREQLDERGVQSLTDALQSVAGVVSGQYGRRGWDDYIIRGMRATESVYLDGLKQGSDTWIAQEPFGVQSIEVLKGPASVNFGLVQPGGMVNQVSKRPRPDPFSEIGFTVGNHGMRQATVDIGRPLSDSGKAAWRLNALWSHSDDPTAYVYFKKRHLAPSLTLHLGPSTDLTLLASYQQREYVRQQGLSPYGTVWSNPNGALDRSLFAGDPGMGPYNAWVGNVGWALEHRFDSGWTLRQNVRLQRFDVDGRAVFHGTLNTTNHRTQARNGRLQDIPGHSLMADQSVERTAVVGGLQHALMVGADLRRDIVRFATTHCTVPALDLYAPVYGVAITCSATPASDDTTRIVDVGLYLRDRIKLGQRLTLSLAARHDRVTASTLNHLTGQERTQQPRKTTGNAGLMYEAAAGIAPYVSWANSFYPVSGTDYAGQLFKPETGRQTEAGVKLQSTNRRVQGSLALYELVRRNVTTSDLAHTGYSVQTGEQRARGFEAEVNGDLSGGWNLSGAYTFTDSELTQDNTASRVGRPLDSVPRHSANVLLGRRFHNGLLRGWSVHGGLRHESAKRGFSYSYVVPGYTVADLGVSYQAHGWRAGLNVKNLFDRDYFAGGLNDNVLPLGDPRRVLLNVVFEL